MKRIWTKIRCKTYLEDYLQGSYGIFLELRCGHTTYRTASREPKGWWVRCKECEARARKET